MPKGVKLKNVRHRTCLDSLALCYWRQQEGIVSAMWVSAPPHNLTAIIDRIGLDQFPTSVCRNPRIEIDNRAVLPQERPDNTGIVSRKANDLTMVVDAISVCADTLVIGA